jgi:phage tail sheath protein FI
MPSSLTYPGVYVEEISSGVRTITGVSTAITAFIGYTKRGMINKAQNITSFADFERKYGGLSKNSPLSYAVSQFFMNGGQSAIVVRIAQGASHASVKLNSMAYPSGGSLSGTKTPVLAIEAKEPGAWANGMVITVDYKTAHPESTFNLQVLDPNSGKSESFLGLTMNPVSKRFVDNVISSTSNLITANSSSISPSLATAVASLHGMSISGPIPDNFDFSKIGKDHCQFMITLNEDDGPKLVKIPIGIYSTFDGIRGAIEGAVNSSFGTDDFVCTYDQIDKVFTLTSGEEGIGSFVRINCAPVQDVAYILKLGTANGGREIDAAASIRPAPNGTTSKSLESLVTDLSLAVLNAQTWTLASATIDGDDSASIKIFDSTVDIPPEIPPAGLKDAIEWLRQLLHKKIAEIKPNKSGSTDFMGITSEVVGNTIRITSGSNDPNSVITFSVATGTTNPMQYFSEAIQNVKAYTIGTGLTLGGQSDAIIGSDGFPPSSIDYQGSEANKTGINALLDVDLFNILCLPGVTDGSLDESLAILSSAISFCQEHRAFLIFDCPKSWKTLDDALQHLSEFDSVRSKNAAMYFPRILMPDVLDENRLKVFPQCGVVAGIYARTDASRGVWKAPAGLETTMIGVRSLDYKLTDKENGLLNPLGLNCLRILPVAGPVIWGARTLQGADILGSEWKYIPVRRTALFIEESLYRGLKWVVFEPNDEPLWSQIRLNVEAFMHDLFRKGAFQGQTAKEAYFVKCDKETTTQTDIDLGIVNVLVGFAPLKPAEFVVIQLQQMAGQTMT